MNQTIAANDPISLGDARAAELHARDLQLLAHLRQAAEARDPGVASHMLRISQYTRLIATGMGLGHSEQETVLAATVLHDIGELGVPDAILEKSDSLTPEEFLVVRGHVHHGFAILRHGTSALVRTAAQVALRHHEKFDGSGYPDGLRGSTIPLYARIAAVADVFDALTSHRPHRVAFELDCGLDYLRSQRGRHFDPDCVDAFLAGEARIRGIRSRYRDGFDERLTEAERRPAFGA